MSQGTFRAHGGVVSCLTLPHWSVDCTLAKGCSFFSLAHLLWFQWHISSLPGLEPTESGCSVVDLGLHRCDMMFLLLRICVCLCGPHLPLQVNHSQWVGLVSSPLSPSCFFSLMPAFLKKMFLVCLKLMSLESSVLMGQLTASETGVICQEGQMCVWRTKW